MSTHIGTTKDNLYSLLDDADEDILEDVFYYIVCRIGTIRARELVDRKEKGMEDLSFVSSSLNAKTLSGSIALTLLRAFHHQKNTETDISENVDRALQSIRKAADNPAVRESIANAMKYAKEVERIHSETYSNLIDAFSRKAEYDADEEVLLQERQGPKCKGCGYVLYSNASALSYLCGECEDIDLVEEDDDDRKCAGCGFVFRNPNVEWDLCETCDEDRADIVKKLDDELDEYVSKRVE